MIFQPQYHANKTYTAFIEELNKKIAEELRKQNTNEFTQSDLNSVLSFLKNLTSPDQTKPMPAVNAYKNNMINLCCFFAKMMHYLNLKNMKDANFRDRKRQLVLVCTKMLKLQAEKHRREHKAQEDGEDLKLENEHIKDLVKLILGEETDHLLIVSSVSHAKNHDKEDEEDEEDEEDDELDEHNHHAHEEDLEHYIEQCLHAFNINKDDEVDQFMKSLESLKERSLSTETILNSITNHPRP